MKHGLLLLNLILAGGTAAASAEIAYKPIGTGYMTDDMITQLLDCHPVTYEVEILQAEDDSPYYRVMAPYGEAFAQALEQTAGLALSDGQYDGAGVCHIDIDASNPDDVIFHKTMTGVDFGSGEIFIGINSMYEMVLRDDKFTAPIMGMAVGIGDSAVAANRRGKFRIALPGAVLDDFSLSIVPDSHCLTDRYFRGRLDVGADVAEVRYKVLAEWQEDEIMTAVQLIAQGAPVFDVRGEFGYTMGDSTKETLVAVAFDHDGNTVGYDWCTYYYIDEDNDGWSDCGEASFTDGFLQDMISNIPSQTTVCTMQRSETREGVFRLVNPYAGLQEYPALNAGHEDHNHYIYINAEDPECIYIEESPIGMSTDQYGLMRVSSEVHYYLQAGFELEECKELEMGAIVEDGVMTFPEEALIFSMLGYDNGDWYIADSQGLTEIRLPEAFSFESSVKTSDASAPATPRFYNMHGQPIQTPAPGQIVICLEGNKATKHIVR